MEEGARNGGLSGGVIKNRNSTGCLIIKKKVDEASGGGGYSGPDIVYSRKDKKRQRLAESDSEASDDELPEIHRRRAGSNQVSTSGSSRVRKGVPKGSEFARKKKGVDLDFARDDIFPEARKRITLDVYDFDEYDDLDNVDMRYFETQSSGRMFPGASGGRRELEIGSSRRGMTMSDRKRPFVESTGSEKIRGGNSSFDAAFGIKSKLPIPAMKERFESSSNEAIRLQGKNGVLKLMVKNKVGVPPVAKIFEEVEGSSMSRSRELTPKNSVAHRPVYSEKKVLNDPNNIDQRLIGKMKPRKLLPAKVEEDSDEESEESEEPPRVLSSDAKTPRPIKRERGETEVTPSPDSVQASKSKEAKVKRGSGTEKQLLREKIRSMLVDAGWTIDYRPRKNRDYFDAVYINPAGTAYWSIIKAYDALQKQIEEDGAEVDGENPGIDLISDDVLSKLTRQTQKKLKKEMKRKNREEKESKRKKKAASGKFVNDDPETDCTESGSDEDKLSSFIKQSGIARGRLHDFRNGNGRNQVGKMQQRIEKSSAASSHSIHGRKTKKIGKCTLLVRNADKELNSEDSFVPFKGKRTILSWLIDSGTVKLSEKVLYMNRRRTKVMLEGWITRDGIHCGCCSKILTVSKFEIHAASKLRQPYQNICLASGVSLLQCQVDAWNSQDESQRTGFNTIDVDGDDPNDDTCGICGDGGNLICCDGCPSTLHQSCVGIEMLPPGDWHCPHCSCKFCGLADVDTSQSDENTSNELVECSFCERKYHKTCVPDKNSISNNSTSQISFCGRKCQELGEQLQKLLGVKHDLESGLSWSLIHRNDLDADPSHRGFSQKVEWNAKLAVALTVMNECFLPIADRRSGINLIQNVVYNCRSNFNRLNYGGFYTAVLERGDEIISAASIRIHGNQLAEMPYIGTRHIYRRQGMCRRLLFAIESALRSLKVEKLIIPAISDMMHTWTKVFGFSALEDSHKREMKSLNMLVFPGTDMLQKKLMKQVTSKKDVAACKGTDLCEDDGGSSPLPDLTKGSDMETSTSEASAGDPHPDNDLSVEKSDALQNDHVVEESDALQSVHIVEESAAAAVSLQDSGVSLNADSLPTLALDVPSDIQEERRECKGIQDTEILSELENKKLVKSMPGNIKVDFPSEASIHNLHASSEDVESDRPNKVASAHSGSEVVDGSMVGVPDLASDVKKPSSLDAAHDTTLLMGKPVLDSPTEITVQAAEVVIDAPSEINDKTAEVDSALKPVATSLMMIHPCMDDSNEYDPLSRSAELDAAAGDSIQPYFECKMDASLLINAKTHADSTSEPSGASTVTTLVCSNATDELALQTKDGKPDSSALDDTQMHVEGEKCAASEVKATNSNHLVEASGVSSNGTLVSAPCSDSTDEAKPHALVHAADHCQVKQFDTLVPDTKLTSVSGSVTELHGMHTLESGSPIEQMASDLIENGSDRPHENHVEVAGNGPTCNSASDGLTQISEC